MNRLRPIFFALAKGAFECAIVVVLLATAVFFALRLLPGDPAALILGDESSPVARAALRHKLDLDSPMYL